MTLNEFIQALTDFRDQNPKAGDAPVLEDGYYPIKGLDLWPDGPDMYDSDSKDMFEDNSPSLFTNFNMDK